MVVGMTVTGTTGWGIERCSYEQPELKFGLPFNKTETQSQLSFTCFFQVPASKHQQPPI